MHSNPLKQGQKNGFFQETCMWEGDGLAAIYLVFSRTVRGVETTGFSTSKHKRGVSELQLQRPVLINTFCTKANWIC